MEHNVLAVARHPYKVPLIATAIAALDTYFFPCGMNGCNLLISDECAPKDFKFVLVSSLIVGHVLVALKKIFVEEIQKPVMVTTSTQTAVGKAGLNSETTDWGSDSGQGQTDEQTDEEHKALISDTTAGRAGTYSYSKR